MRQLQIIALLSVLLISAVGAVAQTTEGLPPVIHHDDPVYPAIAQTAHISGEVLLRINTDGESVTDAVAESGPALLQKSAVDNVRTWKFAPHRPVTFHVTFRYKIVSGTQTSFLEIPDIVEINAEPGQLTIDWAWVAIGCFRVRLSSSHGVLTKQIFFSFSGPREQWLSAELLPLGDNIKEADFGRKEGDFLAFTIRLDEPDGKHPETFLVGRLTKNRIVGTFVDDAGVRGNWNGIKFAKTPNTQ
jgi:TonB family protein